MTEVWDKLEQRQKLRLLRLRILLLSHAPHLRMPLRSFRPLPRPMITLTEEYEPSLRRILSPISPASNRMNHSHLQLIRARCPIIRPITTSIQIRRSTTRILHRMLCNMHPVSYRISNYNNNNNSYNYSIRTTSTTCSSARISH